MKKILVLLTLLYTFHFVFAESKHNSHHHKHNSKSKVQKNQASSYSLEEGVVIILADGLVCSFCAYSIEKNLKKLNFIDKKKWDKKNGVAVSPKNGSIKMAVNYQSKDLDFQKVIDSIKEGGYLPRKILFYIQGSLKKDNKKWLLKDAWFSKEFQLKSKTNLALYNNSKVQIKGFFQVHNKKQMKEPYLLEVTSIKKL